MKKIGIIFALLISFYSNAQQNSVLVETFLNQYCTGTSISLKLKTSGNFNEDNKFVIEISDAFGKNFKELKRINSTSTDIIIPLELSFGENYMIRANSTSPAVTGISSNRFKIFTKPIAKLNYVGASQVNPYSKVDLKMKIIGGGSFNLVLNDSTKLNTIYPSYYDSTYTVSKLIVKSFNYKIEKIENLCGVGISTGEAIIKANPYGLLITGLSDLYKSCPGKKIHYSYSVNGSLGETNSFKLRIKSAVGTYQEDIVSKLNEKGFLESTLPQNLEYGKTYSLQLIGSSPEIYSDLINFSIPPKAIIGNVSTGNSQYGIIPSLLVNINQGLPPYVVSLENGQSHYLTKNYSEIPLINLNTKNSFVSIKDQCNSIKSTIDSVNVSLPSFITIDSIPSKNYCVGETLEVPVTTNMTFNSKSKIYFYLWEESYVVQPKFEAKLIDNKLVAKIPPMQGGYYSIMITTENPTTEHIAFNRRIKINQPSTSSLSIRTNPLGSWMVLNPGVGFEPSTVKLIIDDKEHLLNYQNFSKNLRTYEFKINQKKNRVFSLAEVKNECGASQINPSAKSVSFKFQGTQNRNIIIGQIEKSNYCIGEDIKIPFTIEGELSSNEVVELYNVGGSGYNTIKLTEGKTSPIVLNISPSTRFVSNQFLLKISNTEIVSDEKSLTINSKPWVGSNTKFKQVIKNQPLNLELRSSGSYPIYYKLNNEVRTIPHGSFSDINRYERFTLHPKENLTLKIESVNNSCGYMDQSLKSEIKIEAFTTILYFDEYSTSINSRVCTGELLRIPFKGIYIRKNTKIYAELTDLNGLNFKEITTYQDGNEMIVQIPKDLKTSNKYKIRLVAKNPEDTFYSEERSINVFEPVTGKISTKEGKDIIEKNGYESVNLKLEFTGSPTFQTIISNTYNINSTLDPSIRYYDYISYINVNPTKKTTYSIQQLNNFCGFGKISGNVTVSVIPYVSSIKLSKNKVCKSEKVTLSIGLNGDYSDEDIIIVKLKKLVSNTYLTVKELIKFNAKENKSLDVIFPEEFEIGSYGISADFEKYQNNSQSSVLGFVLMSQANINLAGNATVNNGNSTLISAVVSGSTPVSYELNDGSKGVLNSSGLISIKVIPNYNFEYKIISAKNECGSAIFSGQSNVRVNEPSIKKIDIPEMSNYTFCPGASVSLPFKYTGDFVPNVTFYTQISDKEGADFKDIPGAISTQSPIKFILPTNISSGNNYRFRVISSDVGVQSSTSTNFINIIEKIIVKVTGPKYLESNKAVELNVESTTNSGFAFYVIDSISKKTLSNTYINTSPQKLPLNISSPTILKFYALNSCGPAIFNGPNFLKLDLLMASENENPNNFLAYPNPAEKSIKIKMTGVFNLENFSISNSIGQELDLIPNSKNSEEVIFDISNLQDGIYFITYYDGKNRLVERFVVRN
ncbi:MAG: T9SS type A sorting domain-containing protein [Bacteroidetes bacterium]|nr:T9SS type A sorting domain-containing protein [Bacteroidota bacterium]